MLKEDNRKEYQKQTFKQININKKCLTQIMRDNWTFRDFDKINNRIQKDCYQNEEEKLKDQQKLKEELYYIQDDYRSNVIRRKHHQKHQYKQNRKYSISPEYFYATQIQNHQQQDKLVQTLAKYVKNKNGHYIQDI